MRNKLAIAITVMILAMTVVALGLTVAAVWPDDAGPAAGAVATGADEFAPAELTLLPGQVVGPEMPADKAKDDEPEPEPPRTQPEPQPQQPTKPQTRKAVKWKPAVLQVVTNFEAADVRVNGMPYPEYFEPGQPEGMVLPAGGPYNVEVIFGTNTKVYNLHLRPHETRLLLVQLAGSSTGAPPPPPPKKAATPAKKEEPAKAEEKKEEKTEGGKITVYSKPAGTVLVDGKQTEEKTPGSVDLENGRHEVQVKYESGTVSEKKIVRVRNGSRIKLFFRERQP